MFTTDDLRGVERNFTYGGNMLRRFLVPGGLAAVIVGTGAMAVQAGAEPGTPSTNVTPPAAEPAATPTEPPIFRPGWLPPGFDKGPTEKAELPNHHARTDFFVNEQKKEEGGVIFVETVAGEPFDPARDAEYFASAEPKKIHGVEGLLLKTTLESQPGNSLTLFRWSPRPNVVITVASDGGSSVAELRRVVDSLSGG